jgi:hypothetical protein
LEELLEKAISRIETDVYVGRIIEDKANKL